MLEITLPIFAYSSKEEADEVRKNEIMGIEVDLSESSTINQTFYSIDSVGPYTFEGDGGYTSIYSGGISFISPWPIDKIRKKIRDVHTRNSPNSTD